VRHLRCHRAHHFDALHPARLARVVEANASQVELDIGDLRRAQWRIGHEFSAVLGFTFNSKNPDTQYKNGVDMHLDWGASQFLSKQLLAGLVGYAYDQISCDSGSGDRVGCFESRVFSVRPQIGYILPIGTQHQGYLNLKGYKEFGAAHRPEGWNTWLTFAISPAAPTPEPPRKPLITK
jgi:Putative MetA-pathway of phenol degradation